MFDVCAIFGGLTTRHCFHDYNQLQGHEKVTLKNENNFSPLKNLAPAIMGSDHHRGDQWVMQISTRFLENSVKNKI